MNEQFSIAGKVAAPVQVVYWVAALPSVLCNKALKS